MTPPSPAPIRLDGDSLVNRQLNRVTALAEEARTLLDLADIHEPLDRLRLQNTEQVLLQLVDSADANLATRALSAVSQLLQTARRAQPDLNSSTALAVRPGPLISSVLDPSASAARGADPSADDESPSAALRAFWSDVARLAADLEYWSDLEDGGIEAINERLRAELADWQNARRTTSEQWASAARINDALGRAIHLFPDIALSIQIELTPAPPPTVESRLEHRVGRSVANRRELTPSLASLRHAARSAWRHANLLAASLRL